MIRDQDVFEYHERPRPGKLEVIPSKPCMTQRDLSLAYTPGVARPCLAIQDCPEAVNRYTGKGNLVAVVSNGTAVLGLGDIGPLAAKPVMEGKAVLFKRFAGIDVFDLEVDARDPDQLIRVVAASAPTFGGINLEDIKAPECFYVEEELGRRLDIPVFHDDQHGTAIISAAALLNGLVVVGKRIEDARVVVSGAGAAGIVRAQMFLQLGVGREHLLVVDSVGVVHEGRFERMNPYKARFAADTELRTLSEAIRGADVFLGVSTRDVLTPDMLRTMADNPIVLAMANPDPEIDYELAVQTRGDVVMATGRSDFPNQVNRARVPLHLPGCARRAGDHHQRGDEAGGCASRLRAGARRRPRAGAGGVRPARAAVRTDLPHPEAVRPACASCGSPQRSPAAAMDTGVARRPLVDLDAYEEQLERTLGPSRGVMQFVVHTAQRRPPSRLVFADGEDDGVLRAVRAVVDQHIARPLLLGRLAVIGPRAHELGLHLGDDDVVDVETSALTPHLADFLYELRQLHGLTPVAAATRILDPTIFGLMLVRDGQADGFVGGRSRAYPDTIRPAIQLVGLRDGVSRVSAVQLLALKDRLVFCADTMVNIDPSAEELAEIAILAADAAHMFGIEPRVALLSFSSFGSVHHPLAARVARAVQLVREQRPELAVDGEMHVDPAVVEEIAREKPPPLADPGRCQRPHLPQPGSRQHRLQARPATRWRRGHRAHPPRYPPSRGRIAAGLHRHRHREPRRHNRVAADLQASSRLHD